MKKNLVDKSSNWTLIRYASFWAICWHHSDSARYKFQMLEHISRTRTHFKQIFTNEMAYFDLYLSNN